MSGWSRRAARVAGQALLLAIVTLPMASLWLGAAPLPDPWVGLSLTQWHTLLELASMLVCGAVAAVAWNACELEVPRSVHLLGAACAGALLLDAAHTLSIPGLPDLLGANTANRTAAFFIAGRLLIALALLCVAALPWRLDPGRHWVRWVPGGVAAYVLAVLVWGFAAPASLPTLMVMHGGKSLTVLTRVEESVAIFLFVAAGMLFARRLNRPQPFDAFSLLCAAVLMAMGEAALMLPVRMRSLEIVVSHVYKVLGFWMVYRTIVTDSIRAPYQRLLSSRQKLRESEDELRTITDNIPAMVAFVDTDQRFRFVNRNYERWLGLDPQTLLGQKLSDVSGADYATSLQPHLERALLGQTCAIDHRVDGVAYSRGRWLNVTFMPKVDAEGTVSGVYVLSSDITELMTATRRALFLAEHDELTTLPNRTAFQAAVGETLEHSARDAASPPSPFAVILVDVDRFKVLNETLGHAAGDQLLQAMATRMKQVVRGRDLVARMGGDEMCLLLHDVHDAAHASEIAERILAVLRQPIELRPGLPHHMTVSAGIAIFPQDGSDAETLLRHADIAMYRAKDAGRDGFALFGAHDGGPAEARLHLELELRTAIHDDQLVLHFQPRVDVVTGRMIGVEALVRWQHPERGLLAPAHFINIAEETGLVVPMGAWVMRHAGLALKRLQQAGGSGLIMSVNVSALQFRNSRLIDEVVKMLEVSGCAPHQFELELTESAVMDQPDAAEATMRHLKTLGVRLAMDDFGTGYSSLAALKRYPVDCVKIDRSFVNDIPGDAGDSALTRAIIAMGHALGLHVVAEGVERGDQLDFLRREGCDEYQGYWYARPMPEAALTTLLVQTPSSELAAIG